MATDRNGVNTNVNLGAMPSGDYNPIMTPEQFQWMLEYIALQVVVGIQEHEQRMHEPNDSEALRRVKQNDAVRRRAIEKLRAIFVKR